MRQLPGGLLHILWTDLGETWWKNCTGLPQLPVQLRPKHVQKPFKTQRETKHKYPSERPQWYTHSADQENIEIRKRETQNQLQELQNQLQEPQNQLQELQNHLQELQNHLQELQNHLQEPQNPLKRTLLKDPLKGPS